MSEAQELRSGGEGSAILTPGELGVLLTLLRGDGYEVIAPVERDGAIVPLPVESLAELPSGRGDSQKPGQYRLRSREDAALFGFAAPALSWKRFLLLPEEHLLTIASDGAGGFDARSAVPVAPKRAFFGLRACDLHGLQRLDTILRDAPCPDPAYAARRATLFLVAVDCGAPAECCFCASMGCGPAVGSGADIALTEILDGPHRFLARAGSEAGARRLEAAGGRAPAEADLQAASAVHARAEGAFHRTVNLDGLRERLAAASEHPAWEAVAARCLACGNCTASCPTCFCTNVEDRSAVTGESATRWRRWDSCFNLGFSYIHGGAVRQALAARYRQWLTHKFSFWHDQFGAPGCVGCGRCIVWCPVGIDVTEEVRSAGGEPAAVPSGESRP